MSSRFRVRWAGIEFVGDDGEAMFTIGDNGLRGVLEGVEARGARDARPLAHGAFDSPQYLAGRLGSISGSIHARSDMEYEKALSRLASIPVDVASRLVVDSSAGDPLWLDAKRSGSPEVRHVVWGRLGRYSVDLWAPDPRKYGAARPFAGASVQAFHYGNFAAVPVVEVAGPVAAPYTVASQGHQVTVTQSLSAGQSHRIDMSTGWVYRNGVLQAGVVSAADVFTVPPGRQVTVTGPVSMTVRVTDTFI